MRVVAGEFGGRRLVAPSGTDTRPTSDRVRESLFSILGPLDGTQVLDVFAGSGALGIEAISRGAALAVVVERDRNAVRAIRANADALARIFGIAGLRESCHQFAKSLERFARGFLVPLGQILAGVAPEHAQIVVE